jgi:hypothetical protein
MAIHAVRQSDGHSAAAMRGCTDGPAPVLALHGVPAVLAEPIVLLAEILGWQVNCCAPGLIVPARLCMAPLPVAPDEPAGTLPALLAWSPDNNLNEHISRWNASVLAQPICIHRMEQLLQTLGHRGMAAAPQQAGPVRSALPGGRARTGGATGEWGRVDDEDCHARQ